ncbi:UDP-N-acetylglucosamine transferase subunit ALG14 homolog [Zeugodacus cucurbitae]|uniref:UDP-N-acetylglucosamine transferase subunit ALG14 homolog n=1 Tax=Zeugodacus cucurbitae TaxID=28588 RepID=UPI0005968527|nr:UDP-N-acetylglucosamine transferase subunit ALG14 homolog [Zeugodacus cucurbitae]
MEMTTTKVQNDTKYPVYIVLGSGGHTAEMCTINMALLSSSRGKEIYNPLRYIIANDDITSRSRITSAMQKVGVALDDTSFIYVPRSRKVGQSYFSSVFTTLWALLWSCWLVWRDQPKLLLCNGPGTCVPFCLATSICRRIGRLPNTTRIVFVESWCRVRTLSLSGKLMRPMLDLLVVQWPALAEKYKNAYNVKYFGKIM